MDSLIPLKREHAWCSSRWHWRQRQKQAFPCSFPFTTNVKAIQRRTQGTEGDCPMSYSKQAVSCSWETSTQMNRHEPIAYSCPKDMVSFLRTPKLPDITWNEGSGSPERGPTCPLAGSENPQNPPHQVSFPFPLGEESAPNSDLEHTVRGVWS